MESELDFELVSAGDEYLRYKQTFPESPYLNELILKAMPNTAPDKQPKKLSAVIRIHEIEK